MYDSTGHMGSFCKERNKLVGGSNFLVWKKRTDLKFTKHEVTEPKKYNTQELEKYKKG